MNVSRHILIGDIHGCLDEFNELLKALSFNKNKDDLILLGDLVDRGPDSAGVIKKAREIGAESIMGNHEYGLLKVIDGKKPLLPSRKGYYNSLSDKDISYIRNMRPYIKIDNTIAVHAGVRPNLQIEQQDLEDLMYLRYVDHYGEFISIKEIYKLGKDFLGAKFWSEFWKGPESIVYGHNVHSTESPLIEEVSPGVFCYGLDTGCCFGGKLTALILESKEIVQVQSKEAYYRSRY